MTRLAITKLIASKDLAIEWRRRTTLYQVLPFAGVTMIMFAFALDARDIRIGDGVGGTRTVPLLDLVAPGLIWMTVLFSLIVMVQQSYGVERDDGAIDALRVSAVDPAGVFWGKTIAITVQLWVLEALLVLLAVVLYGVTMSWAGFGLFLLTAMLATVGLAAVGILYGGFIAGVSGRESLLPLLIFPAVAPVLIGATRAVESAFGTDGVALAPGWPWVSLLAVFAVAFVVGGAIAYGPLIEEAT